MAAGATYEPIQTYTLGSAASSISFTSIASSWTDLRLVLVSAREPGGGALRARFNSDSTTSYSVTWINGEGSTATSSRGSNDNYLTLGNYSDTRNLKTLDIFSYAGSTYKTSLYSENSDANGSGTVQYGVTLWRSTAAINTIYLYMTSGNIAAGSTATLYGIKAA